MIGAVPYWHVDAFAAQAFSGNPAAVMILDCWPDDRVLQAIGAENNFAETAFLVRDETGDADWQLRWFTPKLEVRLCGHATLASGHVLLGREPETCEVRFRTRKAGIVEVRKTDAAYEVGLPAIDVQPHDWPEAIAALGKTPLEIWRNADGYTVFLYEDEALVRALAPDFAALAAFGEEQFIATARGSRSDVVSRVFVPGAGVNEDSVTGSAHAVLTPFWAGRLARDRFSAFQASQRGGRIACRHGGDIAWLGGNCVTIVEGRFFL